MRKRCTIVLLLIAAVSSLYGQEAQNRISDTPSMLFRGMVAKSYPSNFNGTPYWDTLSFQKGSVMYNGRLYEDVLVNVDAEEQKLVVRQSMDSAPTNPDGRQVEWFTWGHSFFVNLQYLGIRAQCGFYQLFSDSTPAVFKRVDKAPGVTTSNQNGTLIGYRDPHYNSKYTSYHGAAITWWKLENGNLVQLRQRKAKKLIVSSVQDGSFTGSLPGWHGVEGTGAELTLPTTGRRRLPGTKDLPQDYFSEDFSGTLFIPNSQDARYRNRG